MNLFSDLNKEMMKDVRGEKIYYYRLKLNETKAHPVYDEAEDKFFDDPIEVDVHIDSWEGDPQTTKFGTDTFKKLTFLLHYEDIVDRDLDVREGDVISWGPRFYEITEIQTKSVLYGAVERLNAIHVTAVQTRRANIAEPVQGPTETRFDDPDAVQNDFYQQRGNETNPLGQFTGDKRRLVDAGIVQREVGAEISERGNLDVPEQGSSRVGFYGEDEDEE